MTYSNQKSQSIEIGKDQWTYHPLKKKMTMLVSDMGYPMKKLNFIMRPVFCKSVLIFLELDYVTLLKNLEIIKLL